MKRILLLALLALAPGLAAAKSGLLESRHNLSATGPGSIRSTTEKRACIFCHTPHKGASGTENRPRSQALHQHYRSSTMASQGAQSASGASRTCLSCHDGTIAIGQTVSGGSIPMLGTGPGGRIPTNRPAYLGSDLSGSHPVSFKPMPAGKTRDPVRGDAVKLDRGGNVQCTSCHDPHSEDGDPEQPKFLVKSNKRSAICSSCHTLPNWPSSSHQLQTRNFGIRSVNPAVVSDMAEKGCAACHAQHNARGARLVKGGRADGDDKVCLDCHDGRTAPLDVNREMAKPWSHAAPSSGPSGHEASEGPQSASNRLPEPNAGIPRHVACVDCHDPHSVSAVDATAPRASGALAGVWGIDRNGQRVEPVNYEYEVCFKCHADSMNQPQGRGGSSGGTVRRLVTEVNLRRVFDPSSPSSHPVIGPGHSADVPSLVKGLTTASQIYCSDCHASNGAGTGTVPKGPHGSIYPHLLERNYATADRTPESPDAYALCYKCHDRTVLLSSQSGFKLHARHVVDQSTPCSVCHNAHGVTAAAASSQGGAHLMDYDVSVARPGPRGALRYTSRGARSGTCSVSCHGAQHDERAY
ncbi:cytochrome c3 family protein [Anaeromyxobacter paludicola]|uniref:Cytochrome c n=1 Tax=Anaeromyxobacter paludicola TaxID=2918171 RepID=A0ABN6N2G6_9BACT|nr:cytochrome c3 family protein [Anaeromyxobacter paludicola]BDG07407.1 cytochrome c [Anaeromyxobacter paludicola]